jgi:hypothetical protein
MISDRVFDVLRPFAWLAAVAFLVGFVSYLALGHPSAAVADDRPQPAAVSGPSSDDWNLPKHI